MPTYEYECQQCGHHFEVFQSMKDDKLKDCPEEACEGNVKRLLGRGAGIIFKGSGFYETDYRSDSYKQGAKSAESSSSTSDSGGEKKADTSRKADSGNSSKSATKVTKD